MLIAEKNWIRRERVWKVRQYSQNRNSPHDGANMREKRDGDAGDG